MDGHDLRKLIDIVRDRAFESIFEIDRTRGELVRPEAQKIADELPQWDLRHAPAAFIRLQLLRKTPRQSEQPRYRRGRSVFVRTTVQAGGEPPRGQFCPSGTAGISHLGVLSKITADQVEVSIEGADAPLSFSPRDFFGWNEPTPIPEGTTLWGVRTDRSDGLFRAHVLRTIMEERDALEALDLEDSGQTDNQKALVHRLSSRVRLSYLGLEKGYSGNKLGPLLTEGQGGSFTQAAVAALFLREFSALVGFELQVAIGRTLRPSTPHGFLVLTLQPSGERFVIDPAWQEPLTSLDVAFFDENWGHNRELVRFEGTTPPIPPKTDLELTEGSP